MQAGQAAAEFVLASCAEAVQAAVAGCDAAQQDPICQLACSQLTQSCRQLLHPADSNPPSPVTGSVSAQQNGQLPSPLHARVQHDNTADPASTSSSSADDNTMCGIHPAQQVSQVLVQSAVVSAAAVAALRPGVLPQDMALPLLDSLLHLAMESPDCSCREACMVAAASVVNKWPAGMSGSMAVLAAWTVMCFYRG